MYLSLGKVEDGYAVYSDTDNVVDCFKLEEIKEARELGFEISNIVQNYIPVLTREIVKYISDNYSYYNIHISDPFEEYNLDKENIELDKTFIDSDKLAIVLITSDDNDNDCYLFSTSLDGANKIKIIDGENLFRGTKFNVLTLNSEIDTSEMTSMKCMFGNSRIRNLDISMFDTSNVKNISYLFYNSLVRNLEIGSLNFNNVVVSTMAFNKILIKELDLSRTKPPVNLQKNTNMFGYHRGLKYLNIKGYKFNSNPFNLEYSSELDELEVIKYIDSFQSLKIITSESKLENYFEQSMDELKEYFIKSLISKEDDRILDIIPEDKLMEEDYYSLSEIFEDELDEMFYDKVIYEISEVRYLYEKC